MGNTASTSSIAGKTSWPHLFVPILSAFLLKFIAPNSNRRAFLYMAIIIFLLNFMVSIGTSAWAQKKKCDKVDLKKTIGPAFAPATIGSFLALLAYIAAGIVLPIMAFFFPPLKIAMTVVEVGEMVGGIPVPILGYVTPTTIYSMSIIPMTSLLSFIGALIGTTAAMNKTC